MRRDGLHLHQPRQALPSQAARAQELLLILYRLLSLAVILKEAAAILNVTPDNLRGAIARGTLKARKIGRDWWGEPKEVERYRKEHKR